ncbi:MAG: DNA-processing protein DprA [Roseburia sp.]
MKYKYWLAANCHLHPGKIWRLVQMAGSAKALYEMPESFFRQIPGWDPKDTELLLESRKTWDTDAKWEKLQDDGIHMMTIEQKSYPGRLKEIAVPPYALFYRGSMPDEDCLTIAVVGARKCSEYGRRIAMELGAAAARAGIQIISGMALGIDGAAHSGAMKEQGVTHGVLGCGVDICYPRQNRTLYEYMKLQGGLLSEYAPGTDPRPLFFPRRNRIISALSDVVVVVEAREKSGSLITADFALEQGKDIYAVPGRVSDPLSAGCNRLIAQGAGILCSVDEFLRELGVDFETDRKKSVHNKMLLEKDAARVYSVLDLQPRNMEYLIEKTGLEVDRLCDILIGLENVSMVKEVFKNYYIKSSE